MWEKGYILISNITGHKMFIPNWKELRATEDSFDDVFWDNYRRDKKLWYQSGGHLEYMPETVKTYSKLVKTKGAYERNSLNAPVQGTAAIVTKMAFIKYFNHLVKDNLLFTVLIANDVHDEGLIEAPEAIVEQEAKELQRCMEEAGALFCKSVTLKAVPEIADCWKH